MKKLITVLCLLSLSSVVSAQVVSNNAISNEKDLININAEKQQESRRTGSRTRI